MGYKLRVGIDNCKCNEISNCRNSWHNGHDKSTQCYSCGMICKNPKSEAENAK